MMDSQPRTRHLILIVLLASTLFLAGCTDAIQFGTPEYHVGAEEDVDEMNVDDEAEDVEDEDADNETDVDVEVESGVDEGYLNVRYDATYERVLVSLNSMPSGADSVDVEFGGTATAKASLNEPGDQVVLTSTNLVTRGEAKDLTRQLYSPGGSGGFAGATYGEEIQVTARINGEVIYDESAVLGTEEVQADVEYFFDSGQNEVVVVWSSNVNADFVDATIEFDDEVVADARLHEVGDEFRMSADMPFVHTRGQAENKMGADLQEDLEDHREEFDRLNREARQLVQRAASIRKDAREKALRDGEWDENDEETLGSIDNAREAHVQSLERSARDVRREFERAEELGVSMSEDNRLAGQYELLDALDDFEGHPTSPGLDTFMEASLSGNVDWVTSGGSLDPEQRMDVTDISDWVDDSIYAVTSEDERRIENQVDDLTDEISDLESDVRDDIEETENQFVRPNQDEIMEVEVTAHVAPRTTPSGIVTRGGQSSTILTYQGAIRSDGYAEPGEGPVELRTSDLVGGDDVDGEASEYADVDADVVSDMVHELLNERIQSASSMQSDLERSGQMDSVADENSERLAGNIDLQAHMSDIESGSLPAASSDRNRVNRLSRYAAMSCSATSDSHPFDEGDFVELTSTGTAGDVTNVAAAATSFRLTDDTRLRVPNYLLYDVTRDWRTGGENVVAVTPSDADSYSGSVEERVAEAAVDQIEDSDGWMEGSFSTHGVGVEAADEGVVYVTQTMC